METTEKDVHAHEVIDLIRGANPALSVDGVVAEVAKRYGPEARFHTCQDSGMTIRQTLEFLAGRDKIALVDGKLMVLEANVCQH